MSKRPSLPRTSIARCLLVIATLAAAFVAPPVAAQSDASARDDAAIRATIQEYFRGHATADSAVMRAPFLPTAHIEGIRNGAFTSWTVNQYVGNFRGTPAPDEASRKRTVDAVNIVGTAAMVRATLVHGATTFTDYFVLLKVNGEWKIANKVYHAARTS